MLTKFEPAVKNMRNMAEMLVPYTYPYIRGSDPDIAYFKQRLMTLDGYEIGVHFTISQFEDYRIETLQVWGDKFRYLPFSLVCKVARSFLGEEHLYLVEVAKDNRRVYCWSAALDHYKQPFALPDLHAQDCEFDGLRYGYAQPNQFNFY